MIVRWPELVAGRAVPADIFVFFVWVALLLAPAFQEVEFFGLKFRQEIKQAKDELKSEITSMRVDLQNAVAVTVNPHITIPPPPPDSQLPALQERINKGLREVLEEFRKVAQKASSDGDIGASHTMSMVGVSNDVSFLFAVRYEIERQLRRIAQLENRELAREKVGGLQLLRA